MKRSLVTYECIRLKNASDIEKRDFVKSVNFLPLLVVTAEQELFNARLE